MEKDCKSCKHDGNQMFFRTACTGCGVDDIQYQHWEAKTERNPNAESVSANPLLSNVNDGCKCQACGSIYKIDFIVPDKTWEAIKPKNKPVGSGLLCGKCIMDRLIKLNGEDYGCYKITHH